MSKKFRPSTKGLQADRVCDAIRQMHGLLAPTAAQLGVTRTILKHFISNHSTCAAALKEAREALGDKAEQKLFELVEAGDYRAVVFVLSTLCRDRGYATPRGQSPLPAETDNSVTITAINVITVPSGEYLSVDEAVTQHDAPLRIGHDDDEPPTTLQ